MHIGYVHGIVKTYKDILYFSYTVNEARVSGKTIERHITEP